MIYQSGIQRISAIQKYRNKIAHHRELTEDEYDECKKEVEEATKEIASAITRFQTYQLCEHDEITETPHVNQSIIKERFHEYIFDIDNMIRTIEKATESEVTDNYCSKDVIKLLGLKRGVGHVNAKD